MMKNWNRLLFSALFALCRPASAHAFCGPKIEIEEVEQLYVKENLGRPGFLLVDVRVEEVYNGMSPREGIPGGHIDGAINFPLKRLKEEGAAKALEEAGIVKDAEIILYCNTGRKSALFAEALVEEFGFELAKLKNYRGSVTDWSKQPGNKLKPDDHELGLCCEESVTERLV